MFTPFRFLGKTRPLRVAALTTSWRQQATRHKTSTTRVVERELPQLESGSRTKWYVGGALGGAAIWFVCLSLSLNYQRKTSSVVNGTLFTVRYDPRVIALVGDKIDYADYWPWISGTVNHHKGKVDIGFDVAGSTGERARVHFASRRIGDRWHTLDFKVTRVSDNSIIDMDLESPPAETTH